MWVSKSMTGFCTCTGLASPVDLSRKRKKVDKITCNTCGRLSVEGIGPPSASMFSNIERTNFINPELLWKIPTKGIRSARRSRIPSRSLNVGMQQDDKSTKRVELSASDSEKLGVAVLGRRFADKIEHVPIKKRRRLRRFPSPPPRTPSPHCEGSLSSEPRSSSPQPEDFDRAIDGKYASVEWRLPNTVSNPELGEFNGPLSVQFNLDVVNDFVNGKFSEVTDGKPGYSEDFSGIALLAAAACNNSISDDAHKVKDGPVVDELLTLEGTDSSVSATVLERTTTSSENESLFPKDSAHGDNADVSMVQDSSAVVPHNFHGKRESVGGERSASTKDDRLHWDLNTVMEAWELPCDDLNIGSQRNTSEGISSDGVHSERPEKLECCARLMDPEHTLDLLKYSAGDNEASSQVISEDKSLDNSHCPGSASITSKPLSGEKINTSPTNVIIQTREYCGGTSAMQHDNIENVQQGKHDVVLDLAISEKVACESVSLQAKEDSRETFDMPDNETSPTELVSTVTCQMLDVEHSVNKSGKADLSLLSPEHENLCALGTTFGDGQPTLQKKQDRETPAAGTTMDSSLNVELEDPIPKTNYCFGNVSLEDTINDGCGSDVSHGGHVHTIGVDKMTEIQAGYESPFEDGELRESGLYSWEENEVEDETECVDYDSDNKDADTAANRCMSELDSDSCQNDNNRSLTEEVMQCAIANALKESSHSGSLKKFTGRNQSAEACECSANSTGETNNNSTGRILGSDSVDGLDIKVSSDYLRWKEDNVYMQQSRSSYVPCFRAGRVFGSEKHLGRNRPGQSPRDGHWVDSPAGCWDSRNHYQPGYPEGAGHPRTRSTIANSAAKIDRLTYRDQRRAVNYSSKGLYRPFTRRRSPDDADDTYSVHRRMVMERDDSSLRSRGRSGMYQQGFRRGRREEYHGPMTDDPTSASIRPPHYLARCERSFSHVPSRGASFSRSRGKSRSRSRTRSPITFNLRKERNMGARNLSRSPDFRSEARMERMRRMHFQKSNFAADDEDVFISPPRSHFSLECDSRWIDDPNYVSARFRERNSSGRLFVKRQKFDSGGSGRMKSADCFRSMMHPGRFTELSGGVGREHRYDGNDSERTKYRDKYEMIHRMRHRSNSDFMRRFRYNGKDCFEVHNTRDEDRCIRATDRRVIPRSAREERAPFKCSSERMYASVPKSSGVRDCDEDVSR